MTADRKRWPDPADLLRHLGIEKPPEIDLEAIAQYCGATVVYEPLHGCEARLLAHGDQAIITVDPQTHHHRKRFSAAHELGHWMHDRHQTSHACTQAMMRKQWSPPANRGNRDNPELRANRWAADFLMPEHLFAPMVADETELSLDHARNLTRWFHTSFIATAIRMVQFSPVATMLVWSRPGQRYKWFRRDPYMPAALWPRPRPGPYSVAHELLQGSRTNNPGPTLVRWDQWIDHEDPPLDFVIEDSMRMQSGEVFTLLVWNDETLLYDLFEERRPGRRRLAGDRG